MKQWRLDIARKGQEITGYEALVSGIFLLLVLHELYTQPDLLRTCDMLYYAASMTPNIANTLRYQETKNACGEWLKNKFGDQELNQIKKLHYSDEGIASFTLFLQGKKIPTINNHTRSTSTPAIFLAAFALAYCIPGAATALFVLKIVQNVMEENNIKTSDIFLTIL